jgi:NADH-quinone oxidoreductase subunit N
MNEIIIVASLGVLTLLAEIFGFKKILMPIVVAGLSATAVVAIMELNGYDLTSGYDPAIMKMLDFDRYARAFMIVLTLVALVWVLTNYTYFTKPGSESDHLSLILFAVTGGFCMVSYTNFVMLFLGIEILSIPMYVLAGSAKKSIRSNEAALKYFLMGSFATGILLFGIALMYGSTGSFYVYDIRQKTTAVDFVMTPMFIAGMVMLFAAMSFKVSAAPFHFWAPDVYQGSPTPITSFMATFVKTAAIAAFIRLFVTAFYTAPESFKNIILLLVALSLITGNLIAVYQKEVKRMLAYSSISHVGFMLIALLCLSESTSRSALLFYTAAYTVTTLAAFMVLKIVANGADTDISIAAFNGLVKRNPLLAGTMVIAMLSMAGIPPLSGFFAKFNMLFLALNHGYLWLTIGAILASLVGVYYYFKIIISMFTVPEEPVEKITITTAQKVLLLLLTLCIVGLGFGDWAFRII